MARVVVSYPGERVVDEITALVRRPASPSVAEAPHIGLVEISEVQPTELIPGPPGAQGPRGSRWSTGDGPPTATSGVVTGDMYLDNLDDSVWTYNGTEWIDTGTNVHGSPDTGPEILAKLAPVDGAASGLDADMLDGQHGAFYQDYANLTGKPATFPPTLPIPSSGVTGLDAKQTAQDTAIGTKLDAAAYTAADVMAKVQTLDGTGSGLDADLLDGQSGAYYTDLANATGTLPAAHFNDASHGSLGGGTLHAVATAATRGFFLDAASDGTQYVRKNAAWEPVSVPPGTATLDDPPASPINGQLWWETDTGKLYVYYVDAGGAPGQWVQVNGMPTSVPVATAQTRNRIVNPAFQIAQETTSGNTNGAYFSDQWSISTTGLTGVGTAQSSSGQPGSAVYSQPYGLLACSTAQASITGGYWIIMQTIEGKRVVDFSWGSAEAKPALLRIIYQTNLAGTYSVCVRNQPQSHNFIGQFTAVADESRWFEATIPVPVPTGGAWAADNTAGIQVIIPMVTGPTQIGSLGWQTANVFCGPEQINFFSSTANRFRIRAVGLYLDPQNTGVAPAWQMPDEAEELRACQRYFYKVSSHLAAAANRYGGAAGGTLYDLGTINFPALMRAQPTMGNDAPTYTNCSALAWSAIPEFAMARCTVTAVGVYRATIPNVTANSRM